MSATLTDRHMGGRAAATPRSRILGMVAALVGAALVLAVASVPLAASDQAILAVATAVIFLVVNRFPGPRVTLFLVILSLAVSLRYIFWRITETLNFGSPFELMLGSGLALAEAYAVMVLVLGYIQCVRPLRRQVMPLPEDPATWPTVDVFIPTYNESLSIVRATVLAAMAMDWPRDKMKVWILDDGKRDEFRAFAASCGCGYIIRPDNRHAKAGNLNHAMRRTSGEYIAIFDCDHIPTRAFLQLTMGWMLVEPNLAMVQTPHHFYSPDPFQRNLTAGTRVPAEGNMFYGLVQDGNDFWNACFFCGSCAVLRRQALEEIGGVAVETVTEDCHTMLKLHRQGWDSAYLRLPLAAGLATERLALHIGQRMRWARGMLQILRIDNPVFGPGLTAGQRICYLQATSHFLFAIPRVIFLAAPLAYLLLFQNMIAASPLAITAYAVPHLFHAVATNARIQRNWRHSFWSEIYETVLALFLVRLTIVTMLSPRHGKFNVTAKGGLLENGFFDIRAVYPNLILGVLLIAGLVRGIGSLAFFENDTLTQQALLLNSIWALLSLLIVMAALAVGRETRQVRSRARVNATVPVGVLLPDGRVIGGETRDLSQGGGHMAVPAPKDLTAAVALHVEFDLDGERLLVPARVLHWEKDQLHVRWEPANIVDEANVVRAVFGRADAWTDWSNYKRDQPFASLYRVLVSIRGLFRPRDRLIKRPEIDPGLGEIVEPAAPATDGDDVATVRAMAGVAMALLLLLVPVSVAFAQTPAVPPPSVTVTKPPATKAVAPTPATTVIPATPAVRPLPQPPVGLRGQTPGATAVRGTPPADPVPLPPPPAPAQPPASAPTTSAALASAATDATPRGAVRRVVYSLRQLGASGPLALRGTSELQGVEFGVRADEVVTGATLTMTGAMSPALIPEFSNVTVTLNEQYIGTIPANRDQGDFSLELPVSPVFFQESNRLNFRFTGRYTQDCNDPLSGLLWATIYDTSTLTLTLDRLPAQRDLSRLPLPFFDPREKVLLSLPFVLPATPTDQTLKAAGIAASWFGQLAAFRGATFPVQAEPPTDGNAVMVVAGGESRAGLTLPPINGPTLTLVANPNDPLSTILVIAGRNGDEAVTAATGLALGSRTLGAETALVQPPDLAPREPYDAPNWIPTNRPVRLGELVDASALQSQGYVGQVRVPFRTAPDFYIWRNIGFPMDVKFRAPPGPIVDVSVSRLDVSVNNIYLGTTPLARNDQQVGWLSRLLNIQPTPLQSIRLPLPPYNVFGQNDLQLYFDARPLRRGDCVAIPADLRMSVDPDSVIDLSRAHRFTEMPNLQYFVNSGFPFTRMADLSQTAVVLSDRPTSVETSAFLDMMGRIGALTGFPSVGVAIARPSTAPSFGDRDMLVMGTLQRLADASGILAGAPVRLDGNRLSLSQPGTINEIRHLFWRGNDDERARVSGVLSATPSESMALLVGSESPFRSGRSVVALLAGAPQTLGQMVASFRDGKQAPLIQGDLAVLSAGQVTSSRAGSTYTTGYLPFYLLPSWYLRDQPLGTVAFMVLGCVFVGFALFWAMQRRASVRLPNSGSPSGTSASPQTGSSPGTPSA